MPIPDHLQVNVSLGSLSVKWNAHATGKNAKSTLSPIQGDPLDRRRLLGAGGTRSQECVRVLPMLRPQPGTRFPFPLNLSHAARGRSVYEV